MTLEAIFKKHNVPYEPSLLVGQYGGGSSGALLTGLDQPIVKTTTNNNGGKGGWMEQKRQLGVCFECGDKYSLGHQCKRWLMNMEGYEGEKENEEEDIS